ncbi:DUF4231 domain-containing protein [Pseudonocardia xinjiangensis]|uniref:DUF4231 domain-containing protein n=1 Tax=Pseudonocardia xinjiangensis TaxID=75289 RepID=A0ABX1RBU6_9PSEU|nr:DUF4231 domain-containing protein [Pseudonocardia xinjiangensis]NMH77129.1 DUF4231 domain-containing protein [Pseudonocardia xinjiangensis]
MQLSDAGLPGLFHAADQVSLSAQRQFLLASRLRLFFLIAAAATGAMSIQGARGVDYAAVGTVAALVGAILVEVWLLAERPERRWYDGRALAESAKTLAWRFAVHGAPFDSSIDSSTAERLLVEQLSALVRDAPTTAIAPGDGPPVTTLMRTLRAADFDQRREIYIRERVVGQRYWYSNKAQQNASQASRWRVGLLVIECMGVLAALFRAVGLLAIDLAGIVAALGAAGIAWLSIRQHESLGRAYSYAENELAIAAIRLQEISDDALWPVEVDNAEEAISREHTMWRASRSTI